MYTFLFQNSAFWYTGLKHLGICATPLSSNGSHPNVTKLLQTAFLFFIKMIISLWNLTSVWKPLLSRVLSNLKASILTSNPVGSKFNIWSSPRMYGWSGINVYKGLGGRICFSAYYIYVQFAQSFRHVACTFTQIFGRHEPFNKLYGWDHYLDQCNLAQGYS